MIICYGKTNTSNIMTYKHQMENCTTSAGAKKIKLSTLPKWSFLPKKQTNCLRSFTAAILVDTVEWRRLTVRLLLGTIGLAWRMTYASG